MARALLDWCELNKYQVQFSVCPEIFEFDGKPVQNQTGSLGRLDFTKTAGDVYVKRSRRQSANAAWVEGITDYP